ncbi:MAG: hypothetical protein QOI04_83 [Verrucomicrobiota bacterium]|jgi:hypothetical protein
MNQPINVQTYARIAGVLFLLTLVAGGFGEGYVPSKFIVSADAAATVANIKGSEFIFRLGFAGFLIESLCDVTLALIFYVLLRPVSKNVSLLAAFLGVISTAVFAATELFCFMALHLSGNAGYLKSFSPDQLNTLALLSLKFYTVGGAIFSAYYGLAWILRGYLMYRSGYFPKFLAILMGIGGLGFFARNFLLILAPAYAPGLLLMLMFPGGLLLTGWLLVKGVDVAKWEARLATSAT